GPMANSSVELRVSEAYPRDVGRKIVRIDRQTAARLGVEVGDFVKVSKGDRSVVAVVWPLRPDDEGRGIIRMDGYLRAALGVTVGDTVTVEKAE
uniref:Cell division control protein 48, AAA family n=1 Tax=Aeropyrum pernix (strain ATCC 700893 / DSM 11879 / JCM 9820 / NBRC 100138 / K1) TaxID=272557 RepID=UPI001CC33247|nr:Chain A, Cell division control protein 48, AAA family [Aeropyrum pernix K1]